MRRTSRSPSRWRWRVNRWTCSTAGDASSPFVHSRHRVVVESAAAGRLVLRHLSRDCTRPPTLAEHLLVFGLLVALMGRIGTRNLRARFTAESTWRYHHGAWPGEVHLPSDKAGWELCWEPEPAVRQAPADPREAFGTAVQRLLAADPARRWTVAALARELGTSSRTLQRRLSQDGSSFSTLLATARLGVSARLLAETAQQPAEIAYVCGFADQGHFSRAFKRHSAFTPARYRQAFGAEGGQAHLKPMDGARLKG
jgi:AraC-like DNA-binding protein